MASTCIDVKELHNSYIFVADVPGLKHTDVKRKHTAYSILLWFHKQVQVENDSILKISGERKREDNPNHDVKYVRVERSSGKFLRKFNLPANANLETISATCLEGVLTVTVPKIPPPQSHRAKTFDVSVSNVNFVHK